MVLEPEVFVQDHFFVDEPRELDPLFLGDPGGAVVLEDERQAVLELVEDAVVDEAEYVLRFPRDFLDIELLVRGLEGRKEVGFAVQAQLGQRELQAGS